jgi:hypothetical protein
MSVVRELVNIQLVQADEAPTMAYVVGDSSA